MIAQNTHPWEQDKIVRHSQLMMSSFERLTGRTLLNCTGSDTDIAKALFEADFVLVSHGIEDNPIYNYGNRKALQLWEFSWGEFTSKPSRQFVQDTLQEERNKLLAETIETGLSHYSGVRISNSGKHFYIEDGILWNLLNAKKQYCGQAAMFSNYKFIE
ncbi:MEKHLA domain-containing protein [Rivularia sp. PCC 7116]|uniref:MEKHLA domain-containing protein n=1 Tax=Rivularia sp. PCC 7116 TaxID=373994 RepID=UPI00029F0F93|nr:MEKHLA domain-containing protein [Rivularia sp. PCC 7116]AFY53376.1 MEKHLA domain-containing protein [Rivularia sp. PCC 7116]